MLQHFYSTVVPFVKCSCFWAKVYVSSCNNKPPLLYSSVCLFMPNCMMAVRMYTLQMLATSWGKPEAALHLETV